MRRLLLIGALSGVALTSCGGGEDHVRFDECYDDLFRSLKFPKNNVAYAQVAESVCYPKSPEQAESGDTGKTLREVRLEALQGVNHLRGSCASTERPIDDDNLAKTCREILAGPP